MHELWGKRVEYVFIFFDCPLQLLLVAAGTERKGLYRAVTAFYFYWMRRTKNFKNFIWMPNVKPFCAVLTILSTRQ